MGEEENQKFYFGYINLEFSIDFLVENETPVCRAQTGSRIIKLGAAGIKTEAMGRCGH